MKKNLHAFDILITWRQVDDDLFVKDVRSLTSPQIMQTRRRAIIMKVCESGDSRKLIFITQSLCKFSELKQKSAFRSVLRRRLLHILWTPFATPNFPSLIGVEPKSNTRNFTLYSFWFSIRVNAYKLSPRARTKSCLPSNFNKSQI